jgi:hypothetical protein
MRPPWADWKFPQALPGDGTLARYTRPQFLQWLEPDARIVFGDAVMSALQRVAALASFEAVGVLARPMYVCTKRREKKAAQKNPQLLCMATAAMSPLTKLTGERKEYRCAKCRDAGEAPVSGSVPLRVLRLYVMVRAADGLPTPMRMKPLSVILEMPPPEFAWGREHTVVETASLTTARPIQTKAELNQVAYQYNRDDSAAIWLSAGAFRGEDTRTDSEEYVAGSTFRLLEPVEPVGSLRAMHMAFCTDSLD